MELPWGPPMKAFRRLPVGFWLCAIVVLASAQQRAVAAGETGTIAGTVTIVGDVPALPPHPVYKNKEVCGDSIRDERLVVGAHGAVRNVVVTLTDAKNGKAVSIDRPVVLDNLGCAFVPHVATATVGQTLEIRNSDPILHDAHAWLGSRTLFNVGLPKGRTVRETLTEPGLVQINCNVRHTWMRAYVYVAPDPYHTVTDERGTFSLTDVPPGTYTVRVWHEVLGSLERQVTVAPGATAKLDFELKAVAPQIE